MGKSLLQKLINSGRKCECEICKITNWNGLPITLQVHHIDGNRNNDDEANLQILCPNCHSQTDNYCSKNRKIEKKRYYCKNCGKEINDASETGLCRNCWNELQIKNSKRPLKEELLQQCYKLKSYSKIAKEYGVSDKTIKKWCVIYGFTLKELNIKPEVKKSTKNKEAIANKYGKPIYQFDKFGKFLQEFPSIAEASRVTNVSKSSIREVIQNKRITAGGFVWKFKYGSQR